MTGKILNYETVRPSPLYEKLASERLICGVCERRCGIAPGHMGYCRSRANIHGRLYTLAFGDLSALESRPIEIKPFFHFHPGSTALTFSTYSCNFACPWCQNNHLSRAKPGPESGNHVPPEKVVDLALRNKDSGLCVSFQEPTMLFEYCLEVFPLAKKKGLYNCFVSNGYQTEEALRMLRDAGLTGLKIDIKGDAEVYKKYCRNVDVEKVWRNAALASDMGIHMEMVNLVISDVNDDGACIDYIIDSHLKHLGPNVPLHFTRYHPAYEFHNPPTSIRILEMAYERAKKRGILFPYLGNVTGHEYEDTYCPGCGELLIKRLGFRIVRINLKESNTCPKCAQNIPITGYFSRDSSSHQ
ncbi:MAG: radical SAM protein [Thermoplasmata archaeon]|nr:MAG: radical SAM protein [Thermoplasmata archaeon]